MAGTLTIHSNGDGSLLSGHSWIEYKKDGESESTTHGTWGNNPGGKGNGLHENLEQGMKGEESRTARLDDQQEERLFEEIQRYKDKGTEAWGYLNPSSAFAADAWKNATGEELSHRKYGVSNPSELKSAILKANERDNGDTNRTTDIPLLKDRSLKRGRKLGSRRRVKDSTQRY